MRLHNWRQFRLPGAESILTERRRDELRRPAAFLREPDKNLLHQMRQRDAVAPAFARIEPVAEAHELCERRRTAAPELGQDSHEVSAVTDQIQ